MTWRGPCFVIGVILLLAWLCMGFEDREAIKQKQRSGE